MRLASLTLDHYGPFERLDLKLDATPGRINLVVADNGYGKSVIRQAVGDLLFGIPERTPMDFRHGTERMRLLADVTGVGGTRSLVRRKGRGGTLLVDGAVASPEFLRELLGTATREVFGELFGLDTELLRSGGQQLILSQGRLGQVLYAASGGMGRVRDLLASLERQRDELGRTTRHKSKPIWGAMSAWEDAKEELRRTAMKPDDWVRLEREAAEASARLAGLLERHEAGEAERVRLRTLAAVRPWLARLHAAREVLGDAGDAPELPPGFEPRWREALAEHARAASTETAAAAALADATQAGAALNFDAAWLAAEAEIEALAKAHGRALGAEDDLPAVRTALEAAVGRRDALRRELGWDAAVALPSTTAVRDAQKRWREHPDIMAGVTLAETTRDAAAAQLAAIRTELVELPESSDVAELLDLAKLTRAGDPAKRLEAARRKVRDAEAALATALSSIPDRRLPAAALGDTVAPSDARLDAAEKALGQAEAAHAQAARDRSRQLVEIETLAREIATLERTAMLPAPDALGSARARRDALWTGLLASPADRAAAVAFDRAVRAADDVADALIAHGREAAQAQAARDQLAMLRDTLPALEQAAAEADRGRAAARAELAAIALAAGAGAQSPVRPFLAARDKAMRQLRERDIAVAEAADIEMEMARLGAHLAAAMGVEAPPVEALGALLAAVDRRIEAARDLAARRAALLKQAAAHRATAATSDEAVRNATAALADWRTGWTTLVRALHRPDDEPPGTTGEALARIEDLRAVETTVSGNATRVADMRAAIAKLIEQVTRLRRLTPEFSELPAIEAADALMHRFQREKAEAARCRDAAARLVEATTRLAVGRERAAAAALALLGHRATVHADTDEAAERQIQRAREAAAARKDSADALRQLATLGGGLSIEALAERAAGSTAEQDAATVRGIDATQAELAGQIEAARLTRHHANDAVARAGQGTDAAEAAQRREAAQAALARHADEALVLHAAHALLHAALERQAAAADQPLLNRISTVFRAITGGAQHGVAVEETGGTQTMVAWEADGVTRKPLDQLSEGTSDQLYLALRIAALEDYADAGPPLPFIADDVLQTFDDPRTTATLHALLWLSAKVQVIALTHHRHVGELAARLPAGAVHLVRLGHVNT